jgi:hypothetical protein
MFEREKDQSAIDQTFRASGDKNLTLSKINSGMIMPTSTTSNYTPKIHPLKIEINQNVPASDYE